MKTTRIVTTNTHAEEDAGQWADTAGVRNDDHCTRPCIGVGVIHPYHGIGNPPVHG